MRGDFLDVIDKLNRVNGLLGLGPADDWKTKARQGKWDELVKLDPKDAINAMMSELYQKYFPEEEMQESVQNLNDVVLNRIESGGFKFEYIDGLKDVMEKTEESRGVLERVLDKLLHITAAMDKN